MDNISKQRMLEILQGMMDAAQGQSVVYLEDTSDGAPPSESYSGYHHNQGVQAVQDAQAEFLGPILAEFGCDIQHKENDDGENND